MTLTGLVVCLQLMCTYRRIVSPTSIWATALLNFAVKRMQTM